MVFQQFNLFRNKNVLENITEGLIYGYGKSASEAKDIAMEELKRVHMEDYAKMYPSLRRHAAARRHRSRPRSTS
jgi:L-cystine transport system ATP-binding protein